MTRSPLIVAALLAAALAAGGCGAAGEDAGRSARQAAARPPLPVLGAGALPGMSAERRAVTPTILTQDGFPDADLPARLARWGFVRGVERDFRGSTRRFTHVVARTLEFRSGAGAAHYVAFVRSHADDLVGDPATVHPLGEGERGVVVAAPPCGCHLETPLLVAIRQRGARVSSLLVNGPRATPRSARRLLARMP
jgi:hypothetical protein